MSHCQYSNNAPELLGVLTSISAPPSTVPNLRLLVAPRCLASLGLFAPFGCRLVGEIIPSPAGHLLIVAISVPVLASLRVPLSYFQPLLQMYDGMNGGR